MAHAGSDEILAAALEQLARERGGTYTEGVEVSPMEIADASNSPVMWEPEVFDDTYVNHDGIRNDGTRGSTIEQHTEESRNNALFKSLPKDPASRVIWDMVPSEYHYLKQFEKAPREIRLPEEAVEDEISNSIYNQLFEIAGRNSVGDSVPIKPFKTNKGIEYMPFPYGPVQNFPRA